MEYTSVLQLIQKYKETLLEINTVFLLFIFIIHFLNLSTKLYLDQVKKKLYLDQNKTGVDFIEVICDQFARRPAPSPPPLCFLCFSVAYNKFKKIFLHSKF